MNAAGRTKLAAITGPRIEWIGPLNSKCMVWNSANRQR